MCGDGSIPLRVFVWAETVPASLCSRGFDPYPSIVVPKIAHPHCRSWVRVTNIGPAWYVTMSLVEFIQACGTQKLSSGRKRRLQVCLSLLPVWLKTIDPNLDVLMLSMSNSVGP